MEVGGQRHAPAALPLGKTRYPLYRRLGGPQGRSRQVRKITPPPGFDSRTVQPIASRYTEYALPAPHKTSDKEHKGIVCFGHMCALLCCVRFVCELISRKRTVYNTTKCI